MEKNRPVKLSERDVENKKVQIANLKHTVLELEHQLKDFERRLETKIDQRFAEKELEKVKERLEKSVDEDGNDLDDLGKEQLGLLIKSQEEFVDDKIPIKRLRDKIMMTRQDINHKKKHMIKPLKKQIRERKG